MFYPLTFNPIFKERIWGGRDLERLYGKTLPANTPIGESWEVSDRPEDVSVINNGPLAGKTLRWLMENHAAEVLGSVSPRPQRFPLLIKIIDAQQKLSLQVHPPAGVAAKLGGEPKTEMWYVCNAGPDAELFAGLKRGVTRAEFESKVARQTVAECFHRIPVKTGDTLFVPSGRVHALGAHIMIFEVQQNSDTTYRVFDWNRLDAAGKPRQLHIAQSLECIDFGDFEPALCPVSTTRQGDSTMRPLVDDPLFHVAQVRLEPGGKSVLKGGKMVILGVADGALEVGDSLKLKAGQFCLIPACLSDTIVRSQQASTFLQIELGTQ
jgi:mannose-6-phosphate isomerase